MLTIKRLTAEHAYCQANKSCLSDARPPRDYWYVSLFDGFIILPLEVRFMVS